MTISWGVTAQNDQEVAPEVAPAPRAASLRPLDPKARHAGHQGIVWLHVVAIAIWLLVGAVLGALFLAGMNVPPAVLLASTAAALGHALFLLIHVFLGRAARCRAEAAAGAREA